MRFMVLFKANKESEAGVPPDAKFMAEMGKFCEELQEAGVLLAGEGLHPSAKGAKVLFSRDKQTVIDGPFTETKELIASFWMWECPSIVDAIAWVKRCPVPEGLETGEIEIRQVFQMSDLDAAVPPEVRK